jgi:hypothetical protein
MAEIEAQVKNGASGGESVQTGLKDNVGSLLHNFKSHNNTIYTDCDCHTLQKLCNQDHGQKAIKTSLTVSSTTP